MLRYVCLLLDGIWRERADDDFFVGGQIRKWVGTDKWASPFDVRTVHKRIEDAQPRRRPPRE